MDAYLKTVVQEMLKRVGVDHWPGLKFFKMEDWYTLYEWTEKEQHAFEKWMIDYLYNSKDARTALCEVPRRTRKHLKRAVQEFTFCYGWKFKAD